MEVVDREREELLERVKWKKKEWETRSVCRAVLVEMVFKAVDNSMDTIEPELTKAANFNPEYFQIS